MSDVIGRLRAALPRAATYDWRDLRYSIEQADPLFAGRTQARRDWLWKFVERFVENFPRLRATCIGCQKDFEWPQIYRCFDCHGTLCGDCIRGHCQHERAATAADIAHLTQERDEARDACEKFRAALVDVTRKRATADELIDALDLRRPCNMATRIERQIIEGFFRNKAEQP